MGKELRSEPMQAVRRSTRTLPLAVAALLSVTVFGAQQLTLPNQKDSIHFAVIGDSGTGGSDQVQVAQRLTAMHATFPFDIVLMMGDNLYGGNAQRDYASKFEAPYKGLLDANVKFYAALGNHDDATEVMYKPFNMNGKKYYTFKPGNASVRFFALDSNYMDKEQLAWLEKELAGSQSDWKICFFHHPLYSSGKTHGSALETRATLEPIFVKNGVNVVLTGHDHIYERIKLEQGIQHFVIGSGGSLRRGDLTRTDITVKGYDQDYVFMLAEIAGDEFYYAAVSRRGQIIDSGVFQRPQPAEASPKP